MGVVGLASGRQKRRGQALSLRDPEAGPPEAPLDWTHHAQGLDAISHLSQGSGSLQLSGTGSHDWLGGHKRVGGSQAWGGKESVGKI